MLSDEILLLFVSVIDLAFVFYLYHQFGKEGLVAGLIGNLFLVSMLGAELVEVFGFTTNIANVFYAPALITFAIAIEKGVKAPTRLVWIGFFGLLLVITLSGIVQNFHGAEASQTFNDAIQLVLIRIPRVAFASLAAYLLASYLFISLYARFRRRVGDAGLWFRLLAVSFLAQAIDSIIFFAIAFGGLIGSETLFQTMWAGLALKVFVVALSIPFFYASNAIRIAPNPDDARL